MKKVFDLAVRLSVATCTVSLLYWSFVALYHGDAKTGAICLGASCGYAEFFNAK